MRTLSSLSTAWMAVAAIVVVFPVPGGPSTARYSHSGIDAISSTIACFSGSKSYCLTMTSRLSVGSGGFKSGIRTNRETCGPSSFAFSCIMVAAESYRMTGSAIFNGASEESFFEMSNRMVREFFVCSATTPIVCPK